MIRTSRKSLPSREKLKSKASPSGKEKLAKARRWLPVNVIPALQTRLMINFSFFYWKSKTLWNSEVEANNNKMTHFREQKETHCAIFVLSPTQRRNLHFFLLLCLINYE